MAKVSKCHVKMLPNELVQLLPTCPRQICKVNVKIYECLFYIITVSKGNHTNIN